MAIIRHLIDKKTLSILDLLLSKKKKFFHLSEISSLSKIPVASTFRIMNRLSSVKIVDITMLGKMKIYRISSSDEIKDLENSLQILNKKNEKNNFNNNNADVYS
jgi:sugar-specific transcriptional regulator TrmB